MSEPQLAQWEILTHVTLETGVRVPELYKEFCWHLIPFDSLFDSILQGTRSWPGQPFPFCVLCKTEKQIHAHTYRYRHILADSSKYTHIHADTSIYIFIRAHTYAIQAIHADTNTYMYIHTHVCMCMYCMYLYVFN